MTVVYQQSALRLLAADGAAPSLAHPDSLVFIERDFVGLSQVGVEFVAHNPVYFVFVQVGAVGVEPTLWASPGATITPDAPTRKGRESNPPASY